MTDLKAQEEGRLTPSGQEAYETFIAGKLRVAPPVADQPALCPEWDLFPWQRRLVERALDRGRSALFSDTGTGKTRMELAWAHAVQEASGRPVLLLTPLAVGAQIKREAAHIGVDMAGIVVSNYERLHHPTRPTSARSCWTSRASSRRSTARRGEP